MHRASMVGYLKYKMGPYLRMYIRPKQQRPINIPMKYINMNKRKDEKLAGLITVVMSNEGGNAIPRNFRLT